jgi:hypothetical protein
MGARLRGKLPYANVMATLGVFIALGGVSYAAAQLPKNSVGTAQLRKNAVATGKVRNGAVTTAKLRNGAVTGAKVDLASLGTVPSASHAASADSAAHADAATSATHADSATRADGAADADKLGGLAPSAFLTRGFESSIASGYALGSLTDITTLDVSVGSEPHHVLILGSADIFSNPSETCSGFLGLEWEGTDQDKTYTSGTAPTISGQNGHASLSTAATPLLPAGTQHLALRGTTTGACAFETGRLDAVVLGN